MTRAEVARLARVSPAAVTRAAAAGAPLAKAVRRDGMIDVVHPAAAAWIGERRRRAEAAEQLKAAQVDQPDEPDEDDELDGNAAGGLGELGKLTLNELNEQHGHVRELRAFIRAKKDIEDAMKSQMQRLRTQGRLIPVRTVELAISHLDAAFRLLLTDAPRAIAVRIAPDNAATTAALIRDLLSQHLERAKVLLVTAIAANDPLAPIAAPVEPIEVTPADLPYTENA